MGADFTPFGLAVGHATDADGATVLTVVRGVDGPVGAAVALLGRATGTRELDALSPRHVVDRIDAILLTGGSAYGLAAAAGVMQWMEERGRGFTVGSGVVPIVPAAVVFDLAPLGRFGARPTAAMAYDACARAASRDIAEGSVGAGTGATVGKAAGVERATKGGVGCAVETAGPLAAGAVAVVAMPRVDLEQVAHAAAAALHRRVTPSGTSFDGDVIFAVCPTRGPGALSLQAEALATRALERAIERAVTTARGRDGIPGLGDGA